MIKYTIGFFNLFFDKGEIKSKPGDLDEKEANKLAAASICGIHLPCDAHSTFELHDARNHLRRRVCVQKSKPGLRSCLN